MSQEQSSPHGILHNELPSYRPCSGGHRNLIDPIDITDELARLRVDEPTDVRPGECREVEWPEDGVRDFRLRLPHPEDRMLAVQVSGKAEGYPVFLLHGIPGGRVQVVPPADELSRCGFRVYTYDRPGCGRSDRNAGRTIAAVAGDVNAIAREFSLDAYSIIGRSGGSPGALACAALLHDQPRGEPKLDRVVALVTHAPMNAEGLNVFEDMGETNTSEGELNAAELTVTLTRSAQMLQADPWSLLRQISKDLKEPDYNILANQKMASRIAISHALAVERGPYGWIDDELAFRQPWGFNLDSIKIPVYLWCGADDPFTPKTHTQWFSGQIPGSAMDIHERASHFTAMDSLPILDACFGDLAEDYAYSLGRHILRLVSGSVFPR